MAQYFFVKIRQSIQPSKMFLKLEQVCDLLTPVAIKGKSKDTVALKNRLALLAVYSRVSDNMPLLMKSYIQSKRTKSLVVTNIAYRMILVEKIITMYKTDAKQIKVDY